MFVWSTCCLLGAQRISVSGSSRMINWRLRQSQKVKSSAPRGSQRAPNQVSWSSVQHWKLLLLFLTMLLMILRVVIRTSTWGLSHQIVSFVSCYILEMVFCSSASEEFCFLSTWIFLYGILQFWLNVDILFMAFLFSYIEFYFSDMTWAILVLWLVLT